MVENVKLRQIIAKNDFLRIFQQKKIFLENLTSGCHGNMFVRISQNPQILPKSLLVSMETWSHDNSDKVQQTQKRNLLATFYKKTALEYLNSNQNDSSRSENLIK